MIWRRIRRGGGVWREEVAPYPGTGAGIRDGVHLKNVLKHRLAEDPSIVIVMDMRTSTLDSSNQWLLQSRSKAELRYVTWVQQWVRPGLQSQV